VRVNGYVQQYVVSISKGNFPLITHVDTFVDSEEEGDTPITPKNKTEPCNYCNYKRSCRVGAIAEGSQSDD
jgi:ATP-dependent helicase/DNAse subunit B